MMKFHIPLGSLSLASSCTRETAGSERPERINNNFTVGKLVFIFIINGKYNIRKWNIKLGEKKCQSKTQPVWKYLLLYR